MQKIMMEDPCKITKHTVVFLGLLFSDAELLVCNWGSLNLCDWSEVPFLSSSCHNQFITPAW